MTTPVDGAETENDREAALARVISDVADRLRQGEQLELAELCAMYPQFAADLRMLWGTMVVAQNVGSQAKLASSNTHGVVLPPAPGNELVRANFGQYQLLEQIGGGGMGIVYRARQPSLHRDVAIKMIRQDRLITAQDRQRFFVEAEATARLDHPGIVPVYEVGQIDGHPFFSMLYVSGETLAERLHRGPLEGRAAARIMVQISEAIDFAHQRGVLHRDLKPSNILLDAQGQARVSDFGLAKVNDSSSDSLTRTGAVVGTPLYMSPEQASGRNWLVGPAADIYSLGSVLYHMLTGRPPFLGDSPVQLALKIMEIEPPAPRLLDPRIDRDLEMIVIRCLQKPPDLRYATAGDLARDLRAFLNDEPVQARSGRITQVVARWFRETHHAVVLENWGVLWMWHSLVLLVACLLTEVLHWCHVEHRIWYAALWTLGLGAWAIVFWALRRRMGPVTFVERQIAHLWGASLIAITLLTPLEWWLNLAPLTLSPMLGIISGMVFFVKAGILAGTFYVQAACLFASSILMAIMPNIAHIIFGLISAACFFVPGLKYYRQRRQSLT